jgi:hypothetical protein
MVLQSFFFVVVVDHICVVADHVRVVLRGGRCGSMG